jgi:hypothetical protein
MGNPAKELLSAFQVSKTEYRVHLTTKHLPGTGAPIYDGPQRPKLLVPIPGTNEILSVFVAKDGQHFFYHGKAQKDKLQETELWKSRSSEPLAIVPLPDGQILSAFKGCGEGKKDNYCVHLHDKQPDSFKAKPIWSSDDRPGAPDIPLLFAPLPDGRILSAFQRGDDSLIFLGDRTTLQKDQRYGNRPKPIAIIPLKGLPDHVLTAFQTSPTEIKIHLDKLPFLCTGPDAQGIVLTGFPSVAPLHAAPPSTPPAPPGGPPAVEVHFPIFFIMVIELNSAACTAVAAAAGGAALTLPVDPLTKTILGGIAVVIKGLDLGKGIRIICIPPPVPILILPR